MKYVLSLLLMMAFFATSCVDLDFDEPPTGGEPVDITPNATLNDLKAVFIPGTIKVIEDDLIIKATVIADDASGNFYKTLIIQDETGGIELKINAIGLFNQFPIGREIFIRAKGLSIGDYNGLPQLGGGKYLDDSEERIAGIEETLIPTYLTAGKRDQFITPALKSISNLTTNDLSTLIMLENVQFKEGSFNKPYADAITQFSVNHLVEDCDENELILRTSGYADFASALTPGQNGTLTGVMGVFGSDLQLFIRNTADVNMTQDRCNGGGGGGGDLISENFESVGDNNDANLLNWINIATQGTRVWRGKTFSGNTYVQATAFNDTAPFMEAWLITPAIDLTTPKTVRFRTAQAFWKHGSNPIGEVLISTNFNGGDPSTATWVSLNPTLATSANANYDWVDSGLIDLSGFGGSGHIAFKYSGSGPGGVTSTFILDDVVVENK